ncbi:hypothetical protein HDU86_007558 [Geranomyces michiganensis]|nr:hypothetical protein HDU86_007558 [Geranomyces michiganensis]
MLGNGVTLRAQESTSAANSDDDDGDNARNDDSDSAKNEHQDMRFKKFSLIKTAAAKPQFEKQPLAVEGNGEPNNADPPPQEVFSPNQPAAALVKPLDVVVEVNGGGGMRDITLAAEAPADEANQPARGKFDLVEANDGGGMHDIIPAQSPVLPIAAAADGENDMRPPIVDFTPPARQKSSDGEEDVVTAAEGDGKLDNGTVLVADDGSAMHVVDSIKGEVVEDLHDQTSVKDAVVASDAGSSTRVSTKSDLGVVAIVDNRDGEEDINRSYNAASALNGFPVPVRHDSIPSALAPRPSRQASIEAQLESLMSQAAEDMDAAELLIQINARDRQVSLLKHEIEQLKKYQDDLVTRMEQRQGALEELRAENLALKTVNRSLVEDAAAYHTLRSSGPDSRIAASLDTSKSSASAGVPRRQSDDFDDERQEYQRIISDLQSEVKGLNLYFNKITSRLARGDSYLERVLVNDPDSEDDFETDHPSWHRTAPAPAAEKKHHTFPTQLPSSFATSSASAAAAAAGAFENLRSAVPELMRKRPSLSSLSFFRPTASSSSASEHAVSNPASPLMIDSTVGSFGGGGSEAESDGGGAGGYYYPSSPASWIKRMSLFAVGGGANGIGSALSAPTTPTTGTGASYMPTSPCSSDSDDNVVQMSAVLDVSPPR